MTHFAHKNRFTEDGKMSFAPRALAPASKDMGTAFSEALDDALVKFRKEEYERGRGSGQGDVARKRIGGGYIGLECGRQLAFRYHRAEKEDRPSVVSGGELHRHAEAGHWTEAKTAEWLRMAGVDIRTAREDGRQFGYKTAWDKETEQARIAGEIDGVILALPAHLDGLLPLPCLWESKKATDKKWKKFSGQGVKKADKQYYGQLQTNMAYMNVEHTLFSMLNLDNMKFYWEMVPFDRQDAQHLTDRAVQVIQTESPYQMPRVTGDPSDYRCKFCDFQYKCWNGGPVVAATFQTKPLWLTGQNA